MATATTLPDDDEPRRRKVIVFPAPPADRCRALAGAAAKLAAELDVEHLAILEVTAELLQLDDASFKARLERLQSDDAGRALLVELLTGLQVASTDFDRANRALFVLRARLTAGLGMMGGANDR